MDIKKLIGKHEGKSIALVGSGPTALLYSGVEDVSMAINGAIQADRAFDYHIMFDVSLHKKSWFYHDNKAKRIIGYELASQYSIDRRKEYVFHYTSERADPVFDRELTSLSSVDNIAVCAVEMAITMGATTINLYGIDMAEREYFYEDVTKPTGRYSMRTVEFLNKLFALCKANGVEVNIYGSESCRLNTEYVLPDMKVAKKLGYIGNDTLSNIVEGNKMKNRHNKKFLVEYSRYHYLVTVDGYTATLMVPWGHPWGAHDKAVVMRTAQNTLGNGYIIEISEELQPLFEEPELEIELEEEFLEQEGEFTSPE
jgi:hypothetical protein